MVLYLTVKAVVISMVEDVGTSFMMALREHQGSHSQPIYIYKEASGEVQKKDPARLESDVVTGTLMLAPEQS